MERHCLISRLRSLSASWPLLSGQATSQREKDSPPLFFPSLTLRSYRPNYEGWVRSGGTSRGQSKRSWPRPSPAETGLQPNALVPGCVQVFGAYIDKVLGKSPCAPPPPVSCPEKHFRARCMCKLSRLYTEASLP